MNRPRMISMALVLTGCFASAVDGPAIAAATPADSARVHRLAQLGQVWGEIRYRHPWLAYKPIDWDSALVRALPKAEAAFDSASYAGVVAEMLAALGDPVTRLARTEPALAATRDSAPAFAAWDRDLLVLTVRAATGPTFLSAAEIPALDAQIAKARGVILDLRLSPNSSQYLADFTTRSVLPKLFAGELRVPGSRCSEYSGYPPQGGTTSGGYTFGFETSAAQVVAGTPGKKPERIVIVVSRPYVPPLALAMRQQGLASLVAEGDLDEFDLVQTDLLDAGENVKVDVRLEELGAPLELDARVPAPEPEDVRDAALEKAKALARSGARKRGRVSAPMPEAVLRFDKTYSETAYPDRAHRQLAAIRFWNVIRLFYPYLALLDGAWDGALERFLPRFEQAKDAREYAEAALSMSTLIRDGHTTLFGKTIDDVLGPSSLPPIDVLEIEGKPVIVSVGASATAAGLKRGDVIEAVDGEPIADRIRKLEPYLTAATPNALRRRLIRSALAGRDSSEVLLRVSGAGGTREARLSRSFRELAAMRTASEPFRMLPGNIGYVLMERLQPSEVDSMFEVFKDTRAIIFDIRGYPNGTAWPIAPHVNTRRATAAALFERALVTGWGNARYKFAQPPPQRDVPLYRGRTVALIDERAISQSEHTCLFLEATNGTTFVGSPTAGANGDVTRFSLPGGISVLFTGHDVRHADGRQLQRIGIQPDVPVRPTIAGLRANQDEVLERALTVIEGKLPGKPQQ